jgi:hypothetical protein
VRNGIIIADEQLMEEKISADLCGHVYTAKVTHAEDDSMKFYAVVKQIVNTIQFKRINKDQTLF